MHRLPTRLQLSRERRRRLLRVASGDEPADLALVGGRVLNVFTGTLSGRAIGVAEGRIAWVREECGPAREVVDLDAATVVPGLIDAHTHVDILCTPTAFAETAARFGTTAAVADTFTLSRYLSDDELTGVLTALSHASLKLLWGVSAGDIGADPSLLPPDRLEALLAREDVSGAGELTAWRLLLEGDERLGGFVSAAVGAGLRVDGHLPGASPTTLGRLAAAGVTSDHEAITGDELAARIELGIWTMIRHSTLRRDGTELGRAVHERALPMDRLMLTADGLLPQDLARGHMDRVVRAVVEGGVAPIDAVRMATLHPATYLGLDAHLGSLAPGRCADLLVVDDLERFSPQAVYCDGEPVARGTASADAIDWDAWRVPFVEADLTPERIVDACHAAPALSLRGVIARVTRDHGPGDGPPTYLVLVARDGSWITGATTNDLDLHSYATSYTGSRDIFLAGSDPAGLVAAYRRVVRLGGGVASAEAEVALPVFGHLRGGSVEALAADLEAFERTAGVPERWPPLTYLAIFLSLPALPGVALTPDGVVDVRSGTRLAASQELVYA
jgi:adenine deaminase